MSFEERFENIDVHEVHNSKTRRAFEVIYIPSDLPDNLKNQFKSWVMRNKKLSFSKHYNAFIIKEIEYSSEKKLQKNTDDDMIAAFLAKKKTIHIPDKKENESEDLEVSYSTERNRTGYKAKIKEREKETKYISKYHNLEFMSSNGKFIYEYTFKERKSGVTRGALKIVPQTIYVVNKFNNKTGKWQKSTTTREALIDQRIRTGDLIKVDEQIVRDYELKRSVGRPSKYL